MTSAGRDRWLAINFAATIFVSAFLLFQVQPLVSKYILPWFGGSPAVWTACMLFFQSLLFAGYAYAHFSVKWLRPKQQAGVHLILIIAAILSIVFLRIVPSDDWKPTDSSNPVGRILALLAATVGLPYFVLSSTGPLVQAWFARTFPGKIPYRLYALSNFGSLLALLSYPFLFERIYDAPQQASFWSGGFVLYGILCGLAAISIWVMLQQESGSKKPESAIIDATNSTPTFHSVELVHNPSWWQVALWIVLPAFASVTFLAATNHVTTDVTPMPFLWVIPLSLYLVTLIIAFDRSTWYQPPWYAVFTLLAIYVVAAVFSTGLSVEVYHCGTPGSVFRQIQHKILEWRGTPPSKLPRSADFNLGFWTYLAINMSAMFGICMLCHGELVRIRPHPRHLTAYFLMSSAGGAIGGLLVSVVAPQVFVTYFEFKLVLFFGYLLAIGIIVRSLVNYMGSQRRAATGSLVWAIPIFALLVLLTAGVGVYDVLRYLDDRSTTTRYRVRNFFGTLSVIEDRSDENAEVGAYDSYRLMHGGITHGLQFIASERRHIPTTYYSPSSGVGLAIGYYRRLAEQVGGLRVGAVGLGTGTLAAYLDKNDSIRFYEINQAVIDITEPGKWFTYLKDCQGKYDIKLGDARLTLEREQEPQRFHVLVLDAFSGDAIPVHLLTEEAFSVYLNHLATPDAGGAHGAVAVHISNRHVDLEPIVRGIAERFKLRQIFVSNEGGPNEAYRADWIMLTRDDKLVEELQAYATVPDAGETLKPAVLWTDTKNNLIDLLK